MAEKRLMKGNEAMAEAAIRAGCRAYFGYPITPQNEVPAYMSKRLPEVGGVFVQAESELAAINMVFGGGATGTRVMTSSSSPGISLMQEGLSYIAGAEVPTVIVNMMRGGPGLGNIAPSQADYLQSVKGGGHGDYQLIVLAPFSVQELADIVFEAFDLAFKYRNPVMILGDGILGQMSESIELPDMIPLDLIEKEDKRDWAICQGKERNIVRSLYLFPEDRLTTHNLHLQDKYRKIEREICKFETYNIQDSDYLIVAYGTVARVCLDVIDILKEKGINVGMFRPISVWPFPYDELKKLIENKKKIFVIEMAYNQLEQDVRLANNSGVEIHRFNKLGGAIFNQGELANSILKIIKG